jgi:hypothetical protein
MRNDRRREYNAGIVHAFGGFRQGHNLMLECDGSGLRFAMFGRGPKSAAAALR